MLTLAPREEDNEFRREHAKENPFRFREVLAESCCIASRNINVQSGGDAQREREDTTLQDAKCTSTIGLGPGNSVRCRVDRFRACDRGVDSGALTSTPPWWNCPSSPGKEGHGFDQTSDQVKHYTSGESKMFAPLMIQIR